MANKLLTVKGIEARPVVYSGTDRNVTAAGFWWMVERVDGVRFTIPFNNVVCVTCGRIHPDQVVNPEFLALCAYAADTRRGSLPRPAWSLDPVRLFTAVCPRCDGEYLSTRHDAFRVCCGCIPCEARMVETPL